MRASHRRRIGPIQRPVAVMLRCWSESSLVLKRKRFATCTWAPMNPSWQESDASIEPNGLSRHGSFDAASYQSPVRFRRLVVGRDRRIPPSGMLSGSCGGVRRTRPTICRDRKVQRSRRVGIRQALASNWRPNGLVSGQRRSWNYSERRTFGVSTEAGPALTDSTSEDRSPWLGHPR